MAKQKKLKGLITVAVTIILVILLSAGTSIIVNKQGAVQSAAKIKNGLSAYELAVSEGYSGTLQEWLASLKGDSAYKTAVNAGYKSTENEWTQSLNALVCNACNRAYNRALRCGSRKKNTLSHCRNNINLQKCPLTRLYGLIKGQFFASENFRAR